jgi:hypothetical protein
MRVSAEFFATLGVTPVLGRDFFTDDERSTDAVILTHETWVRRFNADPAVVGRTIDADPRALRVIGVLPESFHGLRMSNPAEIPQYFAPLPSDVRTCQGCTERLIARLVPDMAPDGAAAELAAITRDVLRINSHIRAEPSVIVVPLLDRLLGSVRRVLLLLLAAVVSVLLTVDRFVVGRDYFQALGIPLLAGRWLGGQDDTPPGRSLLVSQSFATTRLGGLDPIGQAVHFEPGGPWSTIVGVVSDVRHHRLERRSGPAIYIPQSAFPSHYTRLVARTSGDPRQFERAIVAAVREVDSSQGVFHIQPMEEYVSAALADRRFAVTLVALFGLLSLVLSAIGLYGAVAFSVAQRTAEIGIRCALGADHRDILMMILKQGALLTSMGLAIGLGASVLASRFLTVWLFEVAQLDPLTLGTTAVVLLAVGFCASLIPAISAVRIEPSRALRAD